MNPTGSYTPLSLGPGETGTIAVTFAPTATGTKGATIVRGFLGVDTFNQETDAGDELIDIPYTYKIR